MKTDAFIILLFGFLPLLLTGQPNGAIISFDDLNRGDFDEILDRYHFKDFERASYLQEIFGIVLYNQLPIINEKLDLKIEVVNDTIQFLGCYQGDDFVEQNWVSPTGKAIRLEYFYLDSLVFLEFDWFDKGELLKSITAKADFIEEYSYEPNLIRYAKYNSEGGLRVQGGYKLVDITPPDTLYSFNPFSWEEMVEVKRNREEKTGLWIYFGSGGEAIKQEKY